MSKTQSRMTAFANWSAKLISWTRHGKPNL